MVITLSCTDAVPTLL